MNRVQRILALGGLLLPLGLGATCGRGETPGPDPPRAESAGLTRAADPAALAEQLGVPAESLRPAGLERYDREEYDSARSIWEVELRRARDRADSVAEARVLMWLGLANWRLDDYAAARRHGEASLALKQRLDLRAELSQSFNALGLLAWNEGRLRDALVAFDSARASAARNRDSIGMARAALNIPLVRVELGEFEAARQGLLRARDAGQAVGSWRYEGNALANLAMLEIRLGNPAAAIPLLARARNLYAGQYETGEANALGQLATAWSGLGDLQRGIAAADSGLALARAHGLGQEAASILEVLADLAMQAGSPQLALRRLQEADSLDVLLGLAVERGNNLRRSAALLLELGEASAATARAEQAVDAHRRVEARAELVQDRLQLAQALRQAGDPRRAQREAEAGWREAVALGNLSVMQDVAAVTAQLALQRGDARGSLRYASRVRASAGTSDWALADLRAGALLALGRLEEARVEGEHAVAGLERERHSLAIGPLRSAYFLNRAGPFSRLVAIELARGDTASAFRVAAALPGRALAERLGGLSDSGGPVGRAAERERLLLRAAALEQSLTELGRDSPDSERRDALVRALEGTRAEYEEHLAREGFSPGDRQLGLGSVSLTQVQSQLGDDEALLTLLSGPERLDLFVVRRTGVVHRSSAITARDLAVRVRILRERLVTQPGREIPAGLAEMDRLLLAPARDAGVLRGASRLLIVPHGPLGALPFAALWNEGTGRFLVEDFVVNYLPAVAALNGSRFGTDPAQGPMTVFAPLYDSLPGTAREARTIARLFPGARIRLGRASTEANVRRAFEAGSPVHLASHGSQNSQNPLFSRMIVGRTGGLASGGDGRLEVHEILGIRTTSPLVFLSGCETGLAGAGQDPFVQAMDEGSLAQAFLVAGAGTIVATLWAVGDAAAADITERFYGHLGSGVSPSLALALTQREALRTRTGYGWAAYTSWGSGARKPVAVVRATGSRP
jgi:CHAT domain-containing protein